LSAAASTSSSNTKIENAIFGIDRKTPLELFEARNSIRIAHIALADKYALPRSLRPKQQLRKRGRSLRAQEREEIHHSCLREVVETAEKKLASWP